MLDDRVIERDESILDQLHDRRRDERLGDRRHVEERFGGHRTPVIQAGDAEAARVDHCAIGDDANCHPWDPGQGHHLLDEWREPPVERISQLGSHLAPVHILQGRSPPSRQYLLIASRLSILADRGSNWRHSPPGRLRGRPC